MEAVSFINSTTYGTNMSTWNVSEDGTVPGQIMADLEDGLWFGNKKLPPRPDMNAEFVTALVKGKGGDLFTLKGANAQTGPLQLIYNGSRPSVTCKDGRKKVVPCDPAVHGYNPMKLQGAIIMGTPRRPRATPRGALCIFSPLCGASLVLGPTASIHALLAIAWVRDSDDECAHACPGTGGDNSHSSEGSFFEGVMTKGYSTDAADEAVQADIAATYSDSATAAAALP
jgi:hypothetical protein